MYYPPPVILFFLLRDQHTLVPKEDLKTCTRITRYFTRVSVWNAMKPQKKQQQMKLKFGTNKKNKKNSVIGGRSKLSRYLSRFVVFRTKMTNDQICKKNTK
eukprot:GEMP01114385.1.p1 GENE.GEMP01114385.1~~GEMP01114385.1.p1  ORF type:complete len:112 (-),score=2.92 GEMP01114385.1:325-627(-)